MKQLFQDVKKGTIEIVEVPSPAVQKGRIVVRTHHSVISPGTERNAVSTARDSYLKTARNRPDLVRRVLDGVKRDGLLATYRKVQAKLSEPRALGYSSAGVIEGVGPGCGDWFRVGDRVACAGVGYASHAEVVAVPHQLAAKVPDGVGLDAAAFTTMGAIALHGVRQAEPTLGERVAVIGLGILGLLTVQILRANGARVIAFDLADDLLARARELGAEAGATGSTEDQVEAALAWSGGVGVDAVVVTAASTSDAPMVAAAGMCRDRGRISAVGLVPFGIPREIAFAKELELRVARSYGPGRYDPSFEEHGNDYPIGFVRWTETRNFEAFLGLLETGAVGIDALITHRLPFERAADAYDALMAEEGPRPLGMVLDYATFEATEHPAPEPKVQPADPVVVENRGPRDVVRTAFIGAGGFARSVLLPAFQARSDVELRRVVTSRGLTAVDAQRRFGFEHVGTEPAEVLHDPDVDLVCIATRHDLHAELVVRALRAGKHVFVEKPLALTPSELTEVEQAAGAAPGLLLVGFNRRFAPAIVELRERLAGRGPFLMTYRVNAGALPEGHWLNDPAVGGGRMIGEGCHFVDLLSSMTGDAAIVDVQSVVASRSRGTAQDFAVQLAFDDGSAGQILYTAGGGARLPKERFEIHGGAASAVVDDYRQCRLYLGTREDKIAGSGKGHSEEIAALVEAVRSDGPSPIALDVLTRVTRATFEVHTS